MKTKQSFAALALLAIAVAAVTRAVAWAQDDAGAAPEHTIHEIMERAHKEGLLNKVAAGDASAEEKMELLDLYTSLYENEPPQGDVESYRKLAAEAVAGAARVVVGREGAEATIKGAVKCAACHKDHKPAE